MQKSAESRKKFWVLNIQNAKSVESWIFNYTVEAFSLNENMVISCWRSWDLSCIDRSVPWIESEYLPCLGKFRFIGVKTNAEGKDVLVH